MEPLSEQCEREAENTRSELAETIDELRRRMTPGRIADEALDCARVTPVAEFLRNLGRDVRDYPLPLLLIGAGVAWLIAASSLRRRSVIVHPPAIDPAERLRSPSALIATPSPHDEWDVAPVSTTPE
jgi:hypothetical protein